MKPFILTLSGQDVLKTENKFSRFYLRILFLFILTTQFSFAQWVTNGPYGGGINALATIGGKVFAGTGNGVFVSSDNGQNWNTAHTGIERKPVAALVHKENKLFAGVYDSGVYLSSNNGNTWMPKNTGLTNFSISGMFSGSAGLFAGIADLCGYG